MAKKSVNDPESLGWTDDGNGFWSWSDGGSAESAVLQDREEDQQVVSKFTFTGTPEENGMGFTNVPNKFVVDTESQKATFQYGLDNSALPDAMNPWNVTVEGSLTTSSTGFPFSLITYDAFGIKKSPKDFGVASASILHRYADDSPERWIVKPNLEVEGDGTFSGSVTASDYLDADGNSIVGGTGGGSSLWEQNGDNIYYNDGKVGIGTDDPQAGLHVDGEVLVKTDDGASATINVESSSNQAAVNLKTPDGGFKISTEKAESDPAASFKIIDRTDGFRNRLVIDAAGSVGIGMDPEVVTFDLSAKEQLKEWKTKAKKASWPIVTDGAFEQEPTEDLVEQWIETRAAGDRLQVKGNGSFSNTITSAASDWTDGTNSGTRMSPGSGLFSKNPSYAHLTCYNEGVGNAYTVAEILKNGAANFSSTVTASGFKGTNFFRPGNGTQDTGGFKFTTANSVRPIDGTGTLSNGVFNLGDAGYRFKDAHFSGTVNATTISSGSMKLTTDGRLLRTTDGSGLGLYFQGGANNVILPTDGDGALINDGPSLGNTARQFKNGYFYGTVKSDSLKTDGAKYSSNEEYAYLVAGTDGWTGATTNWDTYGFQHKIKTDGSGVVRLTIDTHLGEKFSMKNNGDTIFSGSVTANGDLMASKSPFGNTSLAVGSAAGETNQGIEAVAIGYVSGRTNQGGLSVAVGTTAGQEDQGGSAVSVGYGAGYQNQGSFAVGVGYVAGKKIQGQNAVAVGNYAGYDIQGKYAVAVGNASGSNTQGDYSVALGYTAGQNVQGSNSVAIGRGAGITGQGDNGIIINSTGASLNDTSTGHIIIKSSTQDLRSLPNGGFAMNRDPIIGTRSLIKTLSTLRNATKDETTLEGLRDSIGNAIGGLIEKFEAEIAAMPAPETGTMETLQ